MADLTAVLDEIGKPRVHLVGHDWGSLQGWEAALRFPDRLASFTSFGGPGLDHAARFMRGPGALGQALRSWYIGAFQLPYLPELAWRTFGPRALARFLRVTEGLAGRPGHPAASLVRDGMNGVNLYRANMFPRLRAPRANPVVTIPVQLIETTRDRFVSPKLVRAADGWVPELRYRRLAAGHWAQRSHPAEIAGLIADFVDSAQNGQLAGKT
ncbi:hypothetical protein Acor_42660 [Acrocarpospora corrugata]|uniref:AB hydrolase-1 domain-containing protein n=2 Tax=Acrocarpospora corrugata TaxID=35763 RepID=A0A5M3W4W3_9ACTN|nr:hypothetical protein Acor_42660 [Acrocarpospora corrugata]